MENNRAENSMSQNRLARFVLPNRFSELQSAMNMIVDAINNIRIPSLQSGAGVTIVEDEDSFIIQTKKASSAARKCLPWEVILGNNENGDASIKVAYSTIDSVIATNHGEWIQANWGDDEGPFYVYAEITTQDYLCDEWTLKVSKTYPDTPSASEDVPPTTFNWVIGAVYKGRAQCFVEHSAKFTRAYEAMRTERASLSAYQLPFISYMSWRIESE